MSRLMQLPSLYGVRGSIATQTMFNLTTSQVAQINKIVREIASDPGLAADKFEFIKQLANTIGGDYRSDRNTAEHEFYIAIWRATIYLLHHRDYIFNCTLCGQTEYETISTRKKKAFDRQYPICPHCNQSILGDKVVKLQKGNKGYTLIDGNNKAAVDYYIRRADIEKIVASPIKTIHGSRKVEDPHAIINDAEQRNKWYSVWIWNYFRQILNENVIKTHNPWAKQTIDISGPANVIAVRELVNELKKAGQKHYFDESLVGHTELEVLTAVWTADPDIMTGILVPLVHKYRNFGVEISDEIFSIKVKCKNVNDIPDAHASIITDQAVVMLSLESPGSNDGNEDGKSWSDIIESNIKNIDENPDVNSADELERIDALQTIRNNLPNPICQSVFDIYSQCGKTWAEFSDTYGQKEAAKSHISKFLAIPAKVVDECKNAIQTVCIELGFGVQASAERLPIIDRGDVVVITENDGRPVIHIDTDCEKVMDDVATRHLLPHDYETILSIKHKYARVSGHTMLLRMCSCCF